MHVAIIQETEMGQGVVWHEMEDWFWGGDAVQQKQEHSQWLCRGCKYGSVVYKHMQTLTFNLGNVHKLLLWGRSKNVGKVNLFFQPIPEGVG